MIYSLTNEQKSILHAIEQGCPLLIIIAFAGTGKTTMLVESAMRVPGLKLYLVFNSSVQTEAKEKFAGTNTTVVTINSLAFKYTVQKFGLILKKSYKAREISDLYKTDYLTAQVALRIFDNYCNSGLIQFATNNEDPPCILAKQIFEDMMLKKIDATHNFYLKMFHLLLVSKKELSIPLYSMILLDEAQDTNDVTLAIFYLLKAKQKVLVGDQHQQIYSFRGSINAINKIAGAQIHYLTKSFRFNSKIANKATSFLKKFRNEPLSLIGTEPANNQCTTRAIISRSNGELIKNIKNYIKEGLYFKTVRDPQEIFGLSLNLKKLVQNEKLDHDFRYLYNFKKDFNKVYGEKVEDENIFFDFLEQGPCRNDTEMLSAIKAAKIKDLEILFETSVKNFEKKDRTFYYLTTAHTAKGLEWDSVTVCNDFRVLKAIGEFFADKSISHAKVVQSNMSYLDYFLKHCKEQKYIDELNLYYVAITRAKIELIDQTFLKFDYSNARLDELILENIS